MKDHIKILRTATSLIFIISGLGHIIRPEQIFSQLGKNYISNFVGTIPGIDRVIIASGYPLLLFGILLLIGRYTKISTILLATMTIGITLSTHFGIESAGPFFKNLIILAALYTVYVEEVGLKRGSC